MKTEEKKKAMFESYSQMKLQELKNKLEAAYYSDFKNNYSVDDLQEVQEMRKTVLKTFLETAQNICKFANFHLSLIHK